MNSPRSILEKLRSICEIDVRFEASTPGDADAQSLQRQREIYLGEVPGNYRYLYEKLRSQKGSVLAKVAGRACSGCNMLLPFQLVSEVQKRQALQLCPSCKRILDPGKE